MELKINKERLLETIHVSSSIGGTKDNGLYRLALSKEDKLMRDILVDWMKKEELEMRVDDFGNIYGRREGKIKEGPVVAVGSHLDSQPYGGRFDGVLGVLSALEVIRVLNENNFETDYPIEIVNFTNEEGARFSPPMLGSGGVTGVFSKEFVYSRVDDNHISFIDALKNIDYLGEKQHRLKNVTYFIELHIEQGPVLDLENKPVGIVVGIQGMSWLNVKVTGETNHAGPTPMDKRKDALLSTSKMIGRVNEFTKSFTGLKTTVGRIAVSPNVTNVIPGEVTFTIDIRHEDDEIRVYAIERIKEQLRHIAFIYDVKVDISTTWDTNAVHFSHEVINVIAEAAKKIDVPALKLYSGSGHDSKYINEIAHTGMIFLRSIDGISHNEQELTREDDIEIGANMLLHVLQKLSTSK